MKTGKIYRARPFGYWVRQDESSYDPMWSWRPTRRSAARKARKLIERWRVNRLSFLQGVEMAALSERELHELDALVAHVRVHPSTYEQRLHHLDSCHPQEPQ